MRNIQLNQIKNQSTWDVIIIGGGASGLGVAVDCASRGYRTLLLEAHDFAKGTSSRSTKLLHGGVRYLAQGDIALVKEALRERGRLLKNAAHLSQKQAFVIAEKNWWQAMYYTIGLTIYDFLAGHLSIGKTKYLHQNEVRTRLKEMQPEKLRYGVCYYDGQFDDTRLAINLAQTAIEQGACVLNYVRVTQLQKNAQGKISGVCCEDVLSGEMYDLQASCVVNATGVFANDIIHMDTPQADAHIIPSQGIHLVFDREFLSGEDALMVPKTSDGRVLFAVPWLGKVVVGTTDTLVKNVAYEPKALDEEIDFILNTVAEYFVKKPTRADVKSIFVGLRPLAAPKQANQNTKSVSRSHQVEVGESQLVHIFGGKWTTYRQMAEDTVNTAIKHGLLIEKPCVTENLSIHGNTQDPISGSLKYYGSDAIAIQTWQNENADFAKKIHENYEYTFAQVAWAMQHEMAQTLEDVLARRIRLLFLDARAARDCSPDVAEFMAQQGGFSRDWISEQIQSFQLLCQQYILK